MTKIGIVGASGRMGIALLKAIARDGDAELAHGLIRDGKQSEASQILAANGLANMTGLLTSDANGFIAASDVIIDFSNPALSIRLAKKAAELHKPYICGTTGFSTNEFDALRALSEDIPIVWAPNMSVGVNTLLALVEQTAGILNDSFDIELVEMHHSHKKDAPSGTSLALGRAAARGRGISLDEKAVFSREGITGERERGTIGFATMRGGDVVGDHTAVFAGPGERIELSHKASDRKIYAQGAMRAAFWAVRKPAGFYSMKDVLGL